MIEKAFIQKKRRPVGVVPEYEKTDVQSSREALVSTSTNSSVMIRHLV